jgi:hypothetical protein
MSQRICFIGDSHVAALRLALMSERFAARRGDVAIFGTIRSTLSDLTLRDGKLTSDAPEVREALRFTGGAEAIDLAGYDIFCVVACGTNFSPATMVTHGATTYAFNLPDRQIVSQQLLDAMAVSAYRQTVAYKIVDMLASGTDKPIFLMPDPLWAPSVLQRPRSSQLRKVLKVVDGGVYADWVFRALAAAFSPKAAVLRQPASTVEGGCFTRQEFAKGSVRLRQAVVEHEDSDFAHMNADYGALVLDAFFERIETAKAA